MTEVATLLQQGTVSGKRFLGAIGSAILAAAVIGGISYAAFGFMSQSVRVQAVAFLVYATLTATLCLFFRPATNDPISLRFTGAKALAASVGIFVATVAVIVLFYYCLGSIFGSVPSVARRDRLLRDGRRPPQGSTDGRMDHRNSSWVPLGAGLRRGVLSWPPAGLAAQAYAGGFGRHRNVRALRS